MNFEEKISLALGVVFSINYLTDINSVLEFVLLSVSIVSGIVGLYKHWKHKNK